MRDFFQAYAEFCDLIWTRGKKRDTSFYVDLAWEFTPPVLECGCGTGAIVVDLALAGIPVVGIDKFPEMIAVAERKRSSLAPDAAQRIQLMTADVVTFQTDQRFGFALFSGNTFGCLTTLEEQVRAVRNIRGLLKPAGTLAIVQIQPKHWLGRLQEDWKEGDEIAVPGTDTTFRLDTRAHVDRDGNTVRSRFRMTIQRSGGETEIREAEATERIVTRDDLRTLLESNGYRLAQEWGDNDRSPYRKDSRRMTVLAERL